ncbi:uncharacterized protein LOC117179017 [Belonocnema kinseyi]|uniref:uncharacterized protein LOC117179017 n=1 Tax=Belonocnema kinseyi TaxID=2817044 RepID=UPI00143CCCC2|nr:uncharacterized protein LOC117179017 [Belonocnema kinseyi]
MRGAGMLCIRTGTISLLVLIISHAYGLPLQILPSIPGYIPVYIRNGDQPLIEINPALAEAFHETENYSKAMRNLHLDRISDPQNLDDINKIIDPSPQFVNEYEKNGNSNIMKIHKVPEIIPETIKDDVKKLTVAIQKEEIEPNKEYDSTSKISTEPEEIQFIKVSIVNDLENAKGNLDYTKDLAEKNNDALIN